MGLSSYVGSFNMDTTKTAGQTQAVTGVGFTPKIVIFWWSGTTQTSDGARGEDLCAGFGAMMSSSQRFACAVSEDDAGASSKNAFLNHSQYCIISAIDGLTTINGAADWSSLDADGFTLTIDDQFSVALRVSFLALGGTDLSVFVGNRTLPTATGNFSTTGVGFQPGALITCGNASISDNAGNTNGALGIGWATGDAAGAQAIINVCEQHGVGTTNTFHYGFNDECGAGYSGGSPTNRVTFVSFDADGFTLNRLEGTSASYMYYIALGGTAQFLVGELNTRTDGNDIAETVGFQPGAIMFGSNCYAMNSQDTTADHMCMSIGAGTSTSNRAAQGFWSEDNLADSETSTANYDTAVYANVKDDAIVGLMDIKSIDASGFTCVMDDADPSAYWVTYLAIGAADTGQTVALNQVTETDTAQAIAKLKAKAIGQNTETDTSQVIARLKTKAVAQVEETDIAQALSRLKTLLIGQVTETDTAFTITFLGAQIVAIGQVTETDLAQAIARLKAKAIGQSSETDLAQAIAKLKSRTVGQPSETDTAQSLSRLKSLLVGQVSETDLSQALSGLKAKAIGQVAETDSVFAVGRLKVRSIGQVTETDEAFVISVLGATVIIIGQVTETDLAQAIASLKAKAIVQASESDLAQAVTRVKSHELGIASETDLAQAFAKLKAKLIGQASEIDIAQAILFNIILSPYLFNLHIRRDETWNAEVMQAEEYDALIKQEVSF